MQIKVENISHIFDRKQPSEFLALNKASCSIEQGEFVTIIGQTGSGKTTFIEHFNALLKPTDGKILLSSSELVKEDRKKKRYENSETKKLIKGQKVKQEFTITSKGKKTKYTKKIRSNIGIVFQFAEYQLFEDTIEKDIRFGPISMGVPKPEAIIRAKKYLKVVGLDSSYLAKSPFSLSGGQKRRVALAGILAIEPDVLIFDEPTAGLDPQGEIEMYELFTRLHKSGKTIIIVTHNLDHVLEYSDRTIMFDEGKIVSDGPTLDLMYDKKKLHAHNMELPKLSSLVLELESKGLKIGKVNTIKELAKNLKRKKK